MCGSFSTLYLNDQKYFISFIDDYLLYIHLYLLFDKAESFDDFKIFKIKIKNKKIKIKIMRSDRDGEHYRRYTDKGQISNLFAKFHEKEDIIVQYSMLGILQQNSMAERRNRTLMDMIRSVISNLSLFLSLWSEVLETIVFILNRTPSKAIPKITFKI